MSLRCLSRAELISLKLPQFNLNRDLWSFLSRSLLHIFLPVSLLLHPLLSRFSVFLSHFCAVSCGAPRPLSLALVTPFPSFFGCLQGLLIPSWKLSWCVFSSIFKLHLLIMKTVFPQLHTCSICSLHTCSGPASSHFHCSPACFLTSLPL